MMQAKRGYRLAAMLALVAVVGVLRGDAAPGGDGGKADCKHECYMPMPGTGLWSSAFGRSPIHCERLPAHVVYRNRWVDGIKQSQRGKTVTSIAPALCATVRQCYYDETTLECKVHYLVLDTIWKDASNCVNCP